MTEDSAGRECPHLYFLYNRNRQMLGPTMEFYQEILALAEIGGWRRVLPFDTYLSHGTLVDEDDAEALAQCLEKGLTLLRGRGDEESARTFPISSTYDRWHDIIGFFESGSYQVDDSLQPARLRPWVTGFYT